MRRAIALCLMTGFLGLAVGFGLAERVHQLPEVASKSYAVQPTVEASVRTTTNWTGQVGEEKPLTPEEQTNVAIYERANPSVVNIDTRSVEIDRFLGLQHESEGTGSGAILDREG